LDFKVGDRVVYPNHGVALIERIEELTIAGQSWPCYQLRLVAANAVVVIPLHNAESVGLRRMIGRREVTSVLDRLREDRARGASDWKGRYKENSDRMRSGRLGDVAEVLRSLSFLARSRSLSFREKQMLDKARDLVVSEIAAVEKLEAIQASEMVDQALKLVK
jgi:CarD family transcriptional regulator